MLRLFVPKKRKKKTEIAPDEDGRREICDDKSLSNIETVSSPQRFLFSYPFYKVSAEKYIKTKEPPSSKEPQEKKTQKINIACPQKTAINTSNPLSTKKTEKVTILSSNQANPLPPEVVSIRRSSRYYRGDLYILILSATDRQPSDHLSTLDLPWNSSCTKSNRFLKKKKAGRFVTKKERYQQRYLQRHCIKRWIYLHM